MDWVVPLSAAATGLLLALTEYVRRKRKALSERPPPRRTIPPPTERNRPISSDAPTPPRGTRL